MGAANRIALEVTRDKKFYCTRRNMKKKAKRNKRFRVLGIEQMSDRAAIGQLYMGHLRGGAVQYVPKVFVSTCVGIGSGRDGCRYQADEFSQA